MFAHLMYFCSFFGFYTPIDFKMFFFSISESFCLPPFFNIFVLCDPGCSFFRIFGTKDQYFLLGLWKLLVKLFWLIELQYGLLKYLIASFWVFVDVKFLFLGTVSDESFLTESGLLLLLKDFCLSLSFSFLEDSVRYSLILSLNGMGAYL